VHRVSVSGAAGADTIRILPLTMSADIDAGAGADSLDLPNSRGGDQHITSAAVVLGELVTSFSNVETLWVSGSAGADTVTFAGAAGEGPLTTLDLLDGDDAVTVTSGDPDRPLVIDGWSGNDAVTVIAPADPAQRASVIFDGRDGADTLTARGTTLADTIRVDRDGFSGIGSGATTLVETLLVDASGGSDVINLVNSDARRSTTLDGGAGDDVFNVGSAADGYFFIAADATVRGGAGTDTLRVDERADTRGQSYRLVPGSFSRWLRATVRYDGVEAFKLDAGSGADRIVATPSQTTSYTLNAGAPALPPAPAETGDFLGMVFGGAFLSSTEWTGRDSGTYAFLNAQPVLFTGVETSDVAEPGVADYAVDLSSTPGMTFTFTFNKPVSALDAGDLVITNILTHEVWAATPEMHYDVETGVTFRYNRQPPPGRYSAVLGGTELTDDLGNPFSFGVGFATAKVLQRLAFYNGSHFDGDDAATDARDDGAVATDKSALLPGQAGAFENVITDPAGITGVMIDIAFQPFWVELGPNLFDFRVGAAGVDPADWAAAPEPSGFGVRRG
jgi:hypothetical protein